MLSIADVFYSRPDSTLLVTLTKPVKVLTSFSVSECSVYKVSKQ